MLKHQHRNKINNSQDNMCSLEPSKATAAGPGNCNMTDTQDKDFKIASVNMIHIPKKEINKPPPMETLINNERK